MPDVLLAFTVTDGAIATVIAAVVAAMVSLATLWIAGRRDERTRKRELFAQAFSAVVAYQEFPHAIRRRRTDTPAEERIRLSEALREIQEQLAFHQAWIELEASKETAGRYRTLVTETRRVAGGYMHAAWERPGTSSDADMNITDIDYSELKSLEREFLDRLRDETLGPPGVLVAS